MNRKTLQQLGFKAPFYAAGLWVEDSRGRSICEAISWETAKALAESLNSIPKQVTNS